MQTRNQTMRWMRFGPPHSPPLQGPPPSRCRRCPIPPEAPLPFDRGLAGASARLEHLGAAGAAPRPSCDRCAGGVFIRLLSPSPLPMPHTRAYRPPALANMQEAPGPCPPPGPARRLLSLCARGPLAAARAPPQGVQPRKRPHAAGRAARAAPPYPTAPLKHPTPPPAYHAQSPRAEPPARLSLHRRGGRSHNTKH
ncbi:MAG: hypothetical protein J3K34DRAFT_423922 [Monoraphidium minutum]|nr:MAG: hypothetical protein J3K34DRAFT_423922 [Monoraphidium minutum]